MSGEGEKVLADHQRVADLIKARGIEMVKLGGPDMDGVLRGKRMPAAAFLEGLENGFAQCDVIFGWDIAEELVPGLEFTGWHSGYPDMIMRPDLDTFRVVPWEPGVAVVIVDYLTEHGDPVTITPRHVLQRVLGRLAARGWRAEMALELECHLYREDAASLRAKGFADLTPISPHTSCYSIHRATGDDGPLSRMVRLMREHGIAIEGYNREHGPGMYEVNLPHAPALQAADMALLFRNGFKEMAQQDGLAVTFMAKWSDAEDGTSGHVHQSLWDEAGHNLFHDPAAPHGLSALLRQYTAGLLETLPEFLALFAPNINSYKRFVPGTWAPTRAAWGVESRTCAVRAVPGSAAATRVEHRVPGSDVNPYLAFAAALASGLHGIEAGLDPGPPVRGNAYELSEEQAPALSPTLGQAIERFAASERARDWFGNAFVEHYATMRRWEVDRYNRVVGSWERARYFEMI